MALLETLKWNHVVLPENSWMFLFSTSSCNLFFLLKKTQTAVKFSQILSDVLKKCSVLKTTRYQRWGCSKLTGAARLAASSLVPWDEMIVLFRDRQAQLFPSLHEGVMQSPVPGLCPLSNFFQMEGHLLPSCLPGSVKPPSKNNQWKKVLSL